jgi:deoxyribose-phosphate aldolase
VKDLDGQKLLEKVAAEVARRFQTGQSIKATSSGVGPPFCAACDVAGQCAKVCADVTSQVVAAGADRLGGAPGIGEVERQIARMIDHTLLKPEATKEEVALLCAEAAKYGFASVCVNPFWVPYCAELLKGHSPMVCTVVGFPLGANQSAIKAEEARLAVAQGATEVDMVVNVGALKGGMNDVVERDIAAVRAAIPGVTLKVILETSLLNDAQKIFGCEASVRAGADFVKTSTGFSTGGATAADIALMRRIVGDELGVKASGGVRTKSDATLMIKAGASRIGASAGVKILQEVAGLAGGVKKAARDAAPAGNY